MEHYDVSDHLTKAPRMSCGQIIQMPRTSMTLILLSVGFGATEIKVAKADAGLGNKVERFCAVSGLQFAYHLAASPARSPKTPVFSAADSPQCCRGLGARRARS
jgi:hypothetical protein